MSCAARNGWRLYPYPYPERRGCAKNLPTPSPPPFPVLILALSLFSSFSAFLRRPPSHPPTPSRLPHLVACLYPALSYLFQFVHFANAKRVPRDNLTTRYMMEQLFIGDRGRSSQRITLRIPSRMEKALVPDPKIMEILSWQKRWLKSVRKERADFVSQHPRRSGVYRSY